MPPIGVVVRTAAEESRMNARSKSGWWIPAGLLLLGALPLLGGALRLAELIGGAAITPSNARFFAAPAPVVLHVIGSCLYFVLGAFQFSTGIRARHPAWHRAAGRILIPAGLVCAASGIWMAVSYPPVFGDGTLLTGIRLLVGGAMSVFIFMGLAAIRRRAFLDHRAWMTRAYALAIAAGTQPLTLGIVFLIFGVFNDATYTLAMAAGWTLNIAVAEWVIRRRANGLVGRETALDVLDGHRSRG
jgi:uncharacterized membrane protein